MILDGRARSTISAESITDEKIAEIKKTLAQYSMNVSAVQITVNHTSPDAAMRQNTHDYFVKAIEPAGRLGVPYIGTASGKSAQLPFQQQIDEVVRVYNEKYFAAREKNHVRILWEPWPYGPNLATSPIGFEALLKGLSNSSELYNVGFVMAKRYLQQYVP